MIFTYRGVGFANVDRMLFDTWFLGERYIFSKSSGEIDKLPAVRNLLRAVSSSW